MYEIDDEVLAKAYKLAKKMVTVLTDVLECDGYNVIQNNKEVAGQTVFHFHIHLIPRYKGDGAGISWTPGKLTDEVRDEILARLNK